MICPVCYNKIEKTSVKCATCGFRISELNTASNQAVPQARKEGRFDDIIYTTQFPKDLNYKKTFYMTVFGGWFGLHNFYIHKTFKGLFNLISLILSLVLTSLIYSGVLSDVFMTLNVYIGALYFATLLMWIFDIINLFTKKFKVPVVLKEKQRKV